LEEQNKFNISTLLVESTAQKGNSSEAIQLAEKYILTNPKNIDMYLQLGRLFEEFPDNPQTAKKQAVDIYQKAFSKSENNEQKDWLKRKISFLSEAK
jgi:tetratricopeptide (TPR) repeat protein